MRPRRDRLWAAAVLALVLLVGGCAGGRRDLREPADVERATVADRPVQAAEPATDEEEAVYHVVQQGQTAWRIATVYGITVEELARANGLADATRLDAGRRLLIPGAESPLHVPPYPAPLTGSPTVVGPAMHGDWTWPVAGGTVLSYFGAPRRNHAHRGIDIEGTPGDRVLAARNGTVVYSADNMRGYGKTVILDHGEGLTTLYAHNAKLLVRPGERVEGGQPIARVGRSGNASTEHCHFEVRRDAIAVDPLLFLGGPSEASR
jgi:murein DD-endopeptidase MepM/ murein hydrolase activator NlpD